MKLWLGGVALLLVMTTAAIQLYPVSRSNPPVRQPLAAPPAVLKVLRRGCFDCHSNETRWPWYSRVAPLSWIIVHHVNRGRQELNFSEWDGYYPTTRRRKLEWIGRAIDEREMPPWWYRLMHPQARLSAADYTLLKYWVESGRAASQ